MCGEEEIKAFEKSAKKEIPPRVRRRGAVLRNDALDEGNTSACAEKSIASRKSSAVNGKYLRVCGEESPTCDYIIKKRENRPLRSIRGGRKAACTSANFRG